MLSKVKENFRSDPSDWALIVVSWAIYLGGIFYFSRYESSGVYIALGAIPVLISAWILGLAVGAFASLLSVTAHLVLAIVRGNYPADTILLDHLVGFSLLAISGMFIGHLRDLQRESKKELLTLSENNQKLIQLSQILEATNQLSTELMSSQDWLKKIPDTLKRIGTAAAIDHLTLMQLTGDGTENYLIKTPLIQINKRFIHMTVF